MTIKLPEAVERSILAAVRTGQFGSADEAVAVAWQAFAHSDEAGSKRPALTVEKFHQQLWADGVIAQPPDPSLDADDDDEPVVIEGEALSETIIRERR